mmetsp:Transcript_67471/g.187013  ORF Transcript_67471/g.187013 Transcript_67471/m.187013 type:complete len:81 (-) Transcript_67471:164-406(-)
MVPLYIAIALMLGVFGALGLIFFWSWRIKAQDERDAIAATRELQNQAVCSSGQAIVQPRRMNPAVASSSLEHPTLEESAV